MGEAWVDHPSWELVGQASEVAGRDLARLLLDADADELRHTRNAQLATFVLSLVVLDAVERVGVEPVVAAGHSLGEYTALVASGALSFDDGVRLVTARGEAMQAAAEAHPGTMAAVLGLDDDKVDIACKRAEGDVWVANYNAPGQVVIAGSTDGVADGHRHRQGARGQEGHAPAGRRRLPHAVHGAGPRRACARRHRPTPPPAARVPVVANVDALPHRDGRRVGAAARPPSSEPGALAPVARSTSSRAWASRPSSSSARAPC